MINGRHLAVETANVFQDITEHDTLFAQNYRNMRSMVW